MRCFLASSRVNSGTFTAPHTKISRVFNHLIYDPDDVAPGGGCELIPSEVGEIKMVFLPPEHPNSQNPIADKAATLQLGIVFFSGPLSEIAQTATEILDKAGRGELSDSFLKVIGAA